MTSGFSALARPARRVVRTVVERGEVILRGRHSLTPPRHLVKYVGGSFKEVGESFLGYLVDLADLRPTASVLDVGCGIGRMAVPLTRYLGTSGSYQGFDIVPVGVEWCQSRISPRFPNFEFRLADIYNDRYNPGGTIAARDYVFGYETGSFDVAIATSVFTHMLPDDVGNYLRETARVLRPGGRFLVTAFLMNDEARAALAGGASGDLTFRFDRGDHLVERAEVPCAAVAYPEDRFRALLASNGLRVIEPIRFGSWSGRADHLSYQDVVIATPLATDGRRARQ